ncbi:transposase [Actinoplanes sp. NPDC051343]|uniref:transposase n=1 Tax=Actinoplanes sp. NPDC051343 TaxID=3363906 RepID=UPI00378C3866
MRRAPRAWLPRQRNDPPHLPAAAAGRSRPTTGATTATEDPPADQLAAHRPDRLADDDRDQLARARATCPHLDALAAHVAAFAEILTARQGQRLNGWITAVEADDQPDLRSFTAGLRRDHDAVVNGLTMTYSSGVVEGHVNRIKMIKRQMYGRANLDLLRLFQQFRDGGRRRGSVRVVADGHHAAVVVHPSSLREPPFAGTSPKAANRYDAATAGRRDRHRHVTARFGANSPSFRWA